MELRQELKMHLTDMKSAMKSTMQVPPKNWLLLVSILGFAAMIYAVGFAHGMFAMVTEDFYRHQRTDAVWRMAEAAAEAKGDVLLTARFRRSAVDFAVTAAAERMKKPPTWDRTAAELLHVKLTRWRLPEENELDLVRKLAEQRLSLLPKPQPDTLEDFRKRGNTVMTVDFEQEYSKTADAYTQVLGRIVSPAELLTDAEVRSHLRYVDDVRTRLGVH